MKKIMMLCLLVASGCFLSCHGNAQTNSAENSNQTQPVAENAVYKIENNKIIPVNGKPTVVDFSADWCGWCKKLHPIFEELKKENNGNINFVTIDVDEYPDVSMEYQVAGIPYLLFLDSNGKVLHTIAGYQPKAELEKAIETYF